MARCELTGKGPVVENLVSHSNIKTKIKSQPNVQQKRLYSPTLKQMVSLKMAVNTLRTIDRKGGLDTFILNQPDSVLSVRARELKSRIRRRMRGGKVAKEDQGAI